jgi:hypothetical protein
MEIIVLWRLLDAVRQIVPCVQTDVNPHHRQPEEACDNAKLDEITCEVIMSPGGKVRAGKRVDVRDENEFRSLHLPSNVFMSRNCVKASRKKPVASETL